MTPDPDPHPVPPLFGSLSRFNRALTVPHDNLSIKTAWIWIGIVYVFGVAIRLLWMKNGGDYLPATMGDGAPLLTSVDGYAFASGIQELEGAHADNLRVPGVDRYAIVALGWLLHKITPFSMDALIFYLPAALGALISIPMVLTGRSLGSTTLGILAAALATAAPAYLLRTAAGYFDTDPFALVGLMMAVYFAIDLTARSRARSGMWAAFVLALYPYLYDGGVAAGAAVAATLAVYLLVFHRKEQWATDTLLLLALSLLPFHPVVRAPLVIVGYYALQRWQHRPAWSVWAGALAFAAAFFYSSAGQVILGKIAIYSGGSGTSRGDGNSRFLDVTSTIVEAQKLPLEWLAIRSSGSVVATILALAGFVMMTLRYRPMVFLGPVLAIGFFSIWGGGRFTMYAAPAVGLTLAWLALVLSARLSFGRRLLRWGLLGVSAVALLAMPIFYAWQAQPRPNITTMEANALRDLADIAKPGAYTITWWDYGYPTWYFSGTSTLTDGSKHQSDNFIISEILTTDSQRLAANLARLSIEAYVDAGVAKKPVTPLLFELAKQGGLTPRELVIGMRAEEYESPEATRELYLYLPMRMFPTVATVELFSGVDLNTGNRGSVRYLQVYANVSAAKGQLKLGPRHHLDLETLDLQLGSGLQRLKHLHTVSRAPDGTISRLLSPGDASQPIVGLYMPEVATLFVMDEHLMASVFVQLFAFEDADDRFFEMVVRTPVVKIYKIKR